MLTYLPTSQGTIHWIQSLFCRIGLSVDFEFTAVWLCTVKSYLTIGSKDTKSLPPPVIFENIAMQLGAKKQFQ